MKRSFLFSLNIFLLSFSSFAEKSAYLNGDFYFANGFSDKKNIILAKEDSCNNAKRELIGFIFGLSYQVNQNMIRSLGVLEVSQDVETRSGLIVLRGASSEIIKEDHLVRCTITYPIKEANLEKERLKSVKNFHDSNFVDIGDINEQGGSIIEIKTIPSNAEIFINNQRWGTTPIRLNGKIPSGKHLFRIDHPNYKIIELIKDIPNIGKIRIEEILKRATGTLRIETEPYDGATVTIDDRNVGHSPTEDISILSGSKIRIKVSHPEAESFFQEITLDRDEYRVLKLTLPLKPAYFSLNVEPRDADIYLDDNKISLGSRFIKTTSGAHKLRVSKKGYDDFEETFELLGGEKKIISTIKLKPSNVSKIDNEKFSNKKFNENYSAVMPIQDDNIFLNYLGGYWGFSGSSLSGIDSLFFNGGVSLGRQLSENLFLNFYILHSRSEVNYIDATLRSSGYQIVLGFPYRFMSFSNSSWLSISPEIINSNHTYTLSESSSQRDSVSFSQQAIGSALIYSYIFDKINNDLGFFFDFKIGVSKFNSARNINGLSPMNLGLTVGVTL